MAWRGERERYWRDVLGRQRQSDLSIRAFCRREGFSEPSFYWWRRELQCREKAPRAGGAPRFGRTTRTAPRRPPKVASFVPITVTPASSAPAYELLLPSGVRVLVHTSAGERLPDVLAALEKPAC